jgi:hypothetical protein
VAKSIISRGASSAAKYRRLDDSSKSRRRHIASPGFQNIMAAAATIIMTVRLGDEAITSTLGGKLVSWRNNSGDNQHGSVSIKHRVKVAQRRDARRGAAQWQQHRAHGNIFQHQTGA